MNTINFLQATACAVILMMTGCSSSVGDPSSLFADMNDPRSKLLLDHNWRFHRGDLEGAETVLFDDASWRLLDLPHDWSI